VERGREREIYGSKFNKKKRKKAEAEFVTELDTEV
jgi:hypothetical protein